MNDPLPALLKSGALSELLGIDPSTLYRWAKDDVRLRGCIFRQTRRSTWWSTQKLRDRGILPALAPVVVAPVSATA